MNFGLLLSQLPHVQESRVHYDACLHFTPANRTNSPHSGSVSRRSSRSFQCVSAGDSLVRLYKCQ
jgi:hypothetical protein